MLLNSIGAFLEKYIRLDANNFDDICDKSPWPKAQITNLHSKLVSLPGKPLLYTNSLAYFCRIVSDEKE